MDKETKEIEKFSIDILRHYKELRSFVDRINDNNIFSISNEDIEGTNRLVSKLEQALRKLNPTQRELIKLRYLDGFDWDLVCDNIGSSKRTAHNINKEAVSLIIRTLFIESN